MVREAVLTNSGMSIRVGSTLKKSQIDNGFIEMNNKTNNERWDGSNLLHYHKSKNPEMSV